MFCSFLFFLLPLPLPGVRVKGLAAAKGRNKETAVARADFVGSTMVRKREDMAGLRKGSMHSAAMQERLLGSPKSSQSGGEEERVSFMVDSKPLRKTDNMPRLTHSSSVFDFSSHPTPDAKLGLTVKLGLTYAPLRELEEANSGASLIWIASVVGLEGKAGGGERPTVLLQYVYSAQGKRIIDVFKTIGEIRSPHLQFCYEAAEYSDGALLVLEFIPGRPLSFYQFSPRQGQILSRQLFEGLSSLHQVGLAHREINLRTISLDERRRRLVIGGLGFATMDFTEGGAKGLPVFKDIGSMPYMSALMLLAKKQPGAKYLNAWYFKFDDVYAAILVAHALIQDVLCVSIFDLGGFLDAVPWRPEEERSQWKNTLGEIVEKDRFLWMISADAILALPFFASSANKHVEKAVTRRKSMRPVFTLKLIKTPSSEDFMLVPLTAGKELNLSTEDEKGVEFRAKMAVKKHKEAMRHVKELQKPQ